MPTENMLSPDKVYTVDDLKNWPNDTVSLAVLGSPVAHSRSPRMHNAALEMLSEMDERFKGWTYYKFDVDPESLADALPMFYEKGFHGLNLTVPHKVHAVSMVKTSSEDIDIIGAVNTLRRTEEGYEGFNTDGYGLSRALSVSFADGVKSVIEGKHVILLGAGGAARGAAYQILQENCGSLWIANRNQERLNALMKILEPWKGKLHGFDITKAPEDLPKEDVVIVNATTLGMKSDDDLPLDLEGFADDALVYDMVYSPPQTLLLKEAEKKAVSGANGLSMLVWQGAKALQIWVDDLIPDSTQILDSIGETMQKALETE